MSTGKLALAIVDALGATDDCGLSIASMKASQKFFGTAMRSDSSNVRFKDAGPPFKPRLIVRHRHNCREEWRKWAAPADRSGLCRIPWACHRALLQDPSNWMSISSICRCIIFSTSSCRLAFSRIHGAQLSKSSVSPLHVSASKATPSIASSSSSSAKPHARELSEGHCFKIPGRHLTLRLWFWGDMFWCQSVRANK